MTAVSVLAARRRMLASAAKRRPSAVPRADEPRGLMLAYTKQLSAIVEALDVETRAALRDEGLRLDSARMDAATELPAGAAVRVAARLRALAKRFVAGGGLLKSLDHLAGGIVAFSKRQWSRQVKAALGIDLTEDPPMAARIKAFRSANVKLIRSLTTEHVQRVHRVLTAAGSGERVETIMREIRTATGASKSRAALIGRDQVLKLNSDVTEARHAAAGVTEYTWSTSRDERVRGRPGGVWAKSDEDHWTLEGTRHRYDDPPVVNPKTGARAHPGRSFQCRCLALPILPSLAG